jgi:hypothetical protein
MMEQRFAPRDEMLSRARNLLSSQGGYPVQALVHCPSLMDQDRTLAEIVAPQIARLHKQQIGGCEVYLTRPPIPHGGAIATSQLAPSRVRD